MRLLLVRHGETPWNAAGRMQGRLDIGLAPQGHRQAEALGRAVADTPLAGVVHTGLLRTRQTLMPLLRRRPQLCSVLHQHPAFAERDYGQLQGLTPNERHAIDPTAAAIFQRRQPEARPPGGESLLDFQSRVATGLQALLSLHQGEGSPSAPWLLCTHGGVLDLFYRWAHGIALDLPRQWPIPNAGLGQLQIQWDGAGSSPQVKCLEWANTSHLEAVVERSDVEF